MTLAPLQLDDLTFKDLSKSSRDRIPAASSGNWTLHAPVDPGVTLLELYAWLMEQRLYRLDQVPRELSLALLALLGESAAEAGVAATVLTLAPYEGDFSHGLLLPRGTAFRLRDRPRPLIFTTGDDLTLAAISQIQVFAGTKNLSIDLQQGKSVALFPASDAAARARLVLWFDQAPLPGRRLSLLFNLDVPQYEVPPQWSPQAVDGISPPAELSWWYPGNAAADKPLPQLVDGTGGLRRSGIVTFAVPSDWEPLPEHAAKPGFVRVLHLETDRATFSSPVVLKAVTANAVIAHHIRRVGPVNLGGQWQGLPPLPGRLLQLPQDQLPPLQREMRLVIEETPGNKATWLPVADFSFSGPDDRVFMLDRVRGRLSFGDGRSGRQPRTWDEQNPVAELTWEVGGGNEGNLGQNLVWLTDVGPQMTLLARNPEPARGGSEAETVEQARTRVAADLQRRERAVTSADYETLAAATPGVAISRAHVALGIHPDYPCRRIPGTLTVFVVPYAPRDQEPDTWITAPQVDPGALAAVTRELEARRLLGTEVYVNSPRYRRLDLRVLLSGDRADESLNRRLDQRLRQWLDALVGGDDGNGWPFGEPVRPSALLHRAQEVLGSLGTVVAVAIGLDGQPATEACRDVAIGPHDLLQVQDISLQYQTETFVGGGLK